jgi:hypothetical protein
MERVAVIGRLLFARLTLVYSAAFPRMTPTEAHRYEKPVPVAALLTLVIAIPQAVQTSSQCDDGIRRR